MARLSNRPTKAVLKVLARAGWVLRPGNPGSGHYVLVKEGRPGIVCVPRHREVMKGTLAKIIKQAGLTLEQFEDLYR